MSSTVALAWKEWRESRWVLAVAAVAFVALPIIAGLEGLWRYHQFGFSPHLIVSWCGGILGTLVGAFAAARDLNGRIADFFRSRAVGVVRSWIIKYAVGLLLLWIACLVPLVIEIWTDRKQIWTDTIERQVPWLALIWAAQYSLGFVCGTLTRRTGPAIMLAFALTLLAYFLPLVVQPFEAVRISAVLETGPGPRFPFLITAITLCLASLAVAVLFVRMNWQVRAGRGLMYWSIALVLLLLFASAAFQVASNLPVLQEIALDPNELLMTLDGDGHRGMLVTRMVQHSSVMGMVRAFEVTPSGVHLGERIPLPWVDASILRQGVQAVWLPAHPDLCFTVREKRGAGPRRVELDVMSLAGTNGSSPVATLDLGNGYDPNNPELPNWKGPLSWLVGAGNNVVVMWNRIEDVQTSIIDVSDPLHPRQVLSNPPPWQRLVPLRTLSDSVDSRFAIGLPPLPNASAEERLRIAVRWFLRDNAAIADGTLAVGHRNGASLLLYELSRLSSAPTTLPSGRAEVPPFELPNGTAEFRLVGHYDLSLLERFINGDGAWSPQLVMGDRYLYVSQISREFGARLARVTVFDVSDPAHPRPVAHFATPNFSVLLVQPLNGDRALIGGDRHLYLVGSPPGAARRAIAKAEPEGRS